MAAQSAECLFSFRESGSSPTHRHLCNAVVSDAATDTTHLQIRRLDDVGRRQAARQLAGHAQPVDGCDPNVLAWARGQAITDFHLSAAESQR